MLTFSVLFCFQYLAYAQLSIFPTWWAGTHTALETPSQSQCPSNTTQPCYSQANLQLLAKAMLDNFMYPANVKQAEAINSTLLSPSIIGRVDVTRTLYGQELNTEYLFGLFSQLAAASKDNFSLLGVPISYDISHYAAFGNVVACTVIIQFNLTAVNTLLPVEVDTWTIFNSQGQVQQYDLTFRWFDYLIDTVFGILQPMLGTSSPAQTQQIVQQLLVQSVCTAHEEYCNGTNQQYDSLDDCSSFLGQQVRFGEPWEMGRDTLLCRMLHQNMVPLRPTVHCPHLGPTGGDMCTDSDTYVSRVMENDFVGGGFFSNVVKFP